MMGAIEKNTAPEAIEQPFICPFCGAEVVKRVSMLLEGIPALSWSRGNCDECGAKYRATFGSSMRAAGRYFYLPGFATMVPMLFLISLVENGRDGAGFDLLSQLLIWPWVIAGFAWLILFMPMLIKKRWHKYNFVWSPAK